MARSLSGSGRCACTVRTIGAALGHSTLRSVLVPREWPRSRVTCLVPTTTMSGDLCVKSTPIAKASSREKLVECLASTGVYAPETMFPNWRGLSRRHSQCLISAPSPKLAKSCSVRLHRSRVLGELHAEVELVIGCRSVRWLSRRQRKTERPGLRCPSAVFRTKMGDRLPLPWMAEGPCGLQKRLMVNEFLTSARFPRAIDNL